MVLMLRLLPYQTMGCLPCKRKYSFVRLKCLLPKNPREADNGRRMGRGKGSRWRLGVDEVSFALGVGSPKQEYEVLALSARMRITASVKGLPAASLVRTGLVGTHGQRSVEQ